MLPAFLEAQFSDGFIVIEREDDVSTFESGRNVFYDILHGLHCAEHGPMISIALITADRSYTIDWRDLPANARPIRFKHMERDMNADGEWVSEARIMSVDFGYQYTDDAGHNVQEVERIVLK